MKENPDRGRPPISLLFKPIYVVQLNWWHWSDEVRVRWLRELSKALLETRRRVEIEIARINEQRKHTA